jgi:hypothetical protein
MIGEALVDCYTDSEKVTAMMTAIQEHLDLPFTTKILGSSVNVVAVDLNDAGEIVAVCKSSGKRRRIRLVDLPLPILRLQELNGSPRFDVLHGISSCPRERPSSLRKMHS